MATAQTPMELLPAIMPTLGGGAVAGIIIGYVFPVYLSPLEYFCVLPVFACVKRLRSCESNVCVFLGLDVLPLLEY